ncbi:hypothetical protein V8E53_009401, partial [Lactarius tabidus]
PVRVPHLMPFHIQYSSPAPVSSTYYRVQPATLLESHVCFPPSAAIEAQLVSAVPTDEDLLRETETAQPQGLPQRESQKRQATPSQSQP